MTEQEFEVMLAEFRQLRKAVAEAVRQIVQQEGEINALQSVIESKGLATAQELDVANVESTRQLRRFLHGPETVDLSPRLVQIQGEPTSRGCRDRHPRPDTREIRPRH